MGVEVLGLQTPPMSGTWGSSSTHWRPGPQRGSGGNLKARQRSPSLPYTVDVGGGGGSVMAVGVQVLDVVARQDDLAVTVEVYVAHPVGHAVWQGILVVVVDV